MFVLDNEQQEAHQEAEDEGDDEEETAEETPIVRRSLREAQPAQSKKGE